MSIRQGLSHDKGKYVVEGFRHEQVRGKKVTNHVMAFMVRVIASKWNQPLGYFLTSGPMVGSGINILLRQCIDKLKNIGLTCYLCLRLGIKQPKPVQTAQYYNQGTIFHA